MTSNLQTLDMEIFQLTNLTNKLIFDFAAMETTFSVMGSRGVYFKQNLDLDLDLR